MLIAKQVILAKWFFGRELSFASNLNLAISRDFVFVNGMLTPTLVEQFGITNALLTGLVLCFVSIFASLFIMPL